MYLRLDFTMKLSNGEERTVILDLFTSSLSPRDTSNLSTQSNENKTMEILALSVTKHHGVSLTTFIHRCAIGPLAFLAHADECKHRVSSAPMHHRENIKQSLNAQNHFSYTGISYQACKILVFDFSIP